MLVANLRVIVLRSDILCRLQRFLHFLRKLVGSHSLFSKGISHYPRVPAARQISSQTSSNALVFDRYASTRKTFTRLA